MGIKKEICGGGLICNEECERANCLKEIISDRGFEDLLEMQIKILESRLELGHCQRPGDLEKAILEAKEKLGKQKSNEDK